MFLMDFGSRAARVEKATRILKQEQIKRVILHYTHKDTDHFNSKGAMMLAESCAANKTELYLLRTNHHDHDTDILKGFATFTQTPKRKIATITARETATLMKLKRIEFEEISHNRIPNKNTCLAVNMVNHDGGKTIFGTDHCDMEFVNRVLSDPYLEDFYTDTTDIPANLSTSHFSFEELCDAVPTAKRDSVTVMHTPVGVPKMAYEKGFNTAVPLLILNEEKYRNTVFPHGAQQISCDAFLETT